MSKPKEQADSVLVILSSSSKQTRIVTTEQWRKIQESLAEKNRENAKISDAIKVESDRAALKSFFP